MWIALIAAALIVFGILGITKIVTLLVVSIAAVAAGALIIALASGVFRRVP